LGQLRRLEHVRALLRARAGVHAEQTRLMLFSGTGFTDELLQVAERESTVQLVSLDRLYQGA
jgi:hypothetical protein